MAGLLASFTMANSRGLYPRLSGRTSTARRTKKKRAAPARSAGARRTKRQSGLARLVKGSAAAKAYMAKIRRKRRR